MNGAERCPKPKDETMNPSQMTIAQIKYRIAQANRAMRNANFDGRYADARRHEKREHQLVRELERRA